MSTAAVADRVLLKCAECGRENEVERIFCHDCGAKLDRSSLAARKNPKVETADAAHKRLQGMFSDRGASFRLWGGRIAKLLGAAIAAALLILMFMPADVPPPVQSSELPRQINMDLEMMTMYHRPPALKYSDSEVNAFLNNALRNKKAALTYSILDFERAIVGFLPGACRLTIERSVFGFPVYTTALYATAVKDGKITAEVRGGWLGRLPIHPALAKYLVYTQADAGKTMARERRLLEKVSGIEFIDKEVIFLGTPSS